MTPHAISGRARDASPEMQNAPPGNPAGRTTTPTTLNVGGDLLSHTLTSAVPSALEGLASGFGMGPGVPPPPQPPTTLSVINGYPIIDPTGPEHTTPPPGSPPGNEHGCVLRVTQWMRTTKRYVLWASPRPISTGRLHPSQGFHPRPINPIVSRGPYPRKVVGDLILERASRLDAFSGYPFRT